MEKLELDSLLNNKVGKQVVNKKNEQGIITEIGDYIMVNFGNRTARFQLSAFVDGYLRFADENLQNEVYNYNNKEIEKLQNQLKKSIEESKKFLAKFKKDFAKEIRACSVLQEKNGKVMEYVVQNDIKSIRQIVPQNCIFKSYKNFITFDMFWKSCDCFESHLDFTLDHSIEQNKTVEDFDTTLNFIGYIVINMVNDIKSLKMMQEEECSPKFNLLNDISWNNIYDETQDPDMPSDVCYEEVKTDFDDISEMKYTLRRFFKFKCFATGKGLEESENLYQNYEDIIGKIQDIDEDFIELDQKNLEKLKEKFAATKKMAKRFFQEAKSIMESEEYQKFKREELALLEKYEEKDSVPHDEFPVDNED